MHKDPLNQYVSEAASASVWSFGAGLEGVKMTYDNSDVGTTGLPKPKIYQEGVKVGYGGHKKGAGGRRDPLKSFKGGGRGRKVRRNNPDGGGKRK